jgi:hypothetical protein
MGKFTPSVEQDTLKRVLPQIAHTILHVISTNRSCQAHNAILRKALQLQHFISKKAFYCYWDKYLWAPNTLTLTECDYDVFLGISPLVIYVDDTPQEQEQEDKTDWVILDAWEQGIYCKPELYETRKLEYIQRKTNQIICAARDLIVLDCHNKLAMRSGGGYYGTKGRRMIFAIARFIIKFLSMSVDDFTAWVKRLGTNGRACCENLRVAACGPDMAVRSRAFRLRIITGTIGANYQRLYPMIQSTLPAHAIMAEYKKAGIEIHW